MAVFLRARQPAASTRPPTGAAPRGTIASAVGARDIAFRYRLNEDKPLMYYRNNTRIVLEIILLFYNNL
jgi:hypothetical protein